MGDAAGHTTWCEQDAHTEPTAPCLSPVIRGGGLTAWASGRSFVIEAPSSLVLDRAGMTEAREVLTHLLDATA